MLDSIWNLVFANFKCKPVTANQEIIPFFISIFYESHIVYKTKDCTCNLCVEKLDEGNIPKFLYALLGC
jgi:hypothetical protein